MILLIRFLREIKRPELFLPHLFSSQPCEETFRQMTSMGSVNYTKINFTLLELFHSVGRIELQNDIVYSKLANMDINFPRNKVLNMSECQFQLPTDDEIKWQMEKARETALKDAFALGMIIDSKSISSATLSHTDMALHEDHDTYDSDEEVLSLQSVECSSFVDCGESMLNEDNSGSFVSVPYINGKTKVIRKSHLIWLLTDSKDGLSSDRLKRVQAQDKKKINRLSSITIQTD